MGGFFSSIIYFLISFILVIISIMIVRKIKYIYNKYFSDIDDVQEKEELIAKASVNIPTVINISYLIYILFKIVFII